MNARAWPVEGDSRVPYWVYTDAGRSTARARAHLRGADLELRRARVRDPEARRLQAHLDRREVGARRARRGRRGRAYSSTAAPTAACSSASRTAGTAPVQVPVPPVDLRPRRPAAGHAVPKGVKGRAACRRTSTWRARADADPVAERHGVVFARLSAETPPFEDYLGATEARLVRPGVRRRELARARLLAPAARRQLEADVREHQGPVPRQPAARLPRHLRLVPRRQPVARRRWTRPAGTLCSISSAAEQELNEGTRRDAVVQRRPRAAGPDGCSTRCASSPATRPWSCRRSGRT